MLSHGRGFVHIRICIVAQNAFTKHSSSEGHHKLNSYHKAVSNNKYLSHQSRKWPDFDSDPIVKGFFCVIVGTTG